MKTALISNLQHASEVYVGAVQKTADSLIELSRGIFTKYDRNALLRKRQKISGKIIERVSELIKEGESDICLDTSLSGLINKLNDIEKDLAAHEPHKLKRENPFKSVLKKFGR